MNHKEKILNYLKENNGVITTQYCKEEGIPRVYLTRLVEENILSRVDRGIYISKQGDYDEYYFFQHKFKSKGTVLFDSNSINYQSKNIIKADESGQ